MELVTLAKIIGPTVSWAGYNVDTPSREIVFLHEGGLRDLAYKLGQPLHPWAVGFTAYGWAFGLSSKAKYKVLDRMGAVHESLRYQLVNTPSTAWVDMYRHDQARTGGAPNV